LCHKIYLVVFEIERIFPNSAVQCIAVYTDNDESLWQLSQKHIVLNGGYRENYIWICFVKTNTYSTTWIWKLNWEEVGTLLLSWQTRSIIKSRSRKWLCMSRSFLVPHHARQLRFFSRWSVAEKSFYVRPVGIQAGRGSKKDWHRP
jgi:hypothetical protein